MRTCSLLSPLWVDDGIWASVCPSGPMNQAPLAKPVFESLRRRVELGTVQPGVVVEGRVDV